MAKFDFDLETAEYELEIIDDLLSVFLGFFEERPEENDILAARLFVSQCKIYESVLVAAWDKLKAIRGDMKTAIAKYFEKEKLKKKGGDVA